MSAIKTTLTLTDLDRRWMDVLVERGEYLSISEYVRSLIRADKQKRAEVELIRAKLVAAEKSGFTDKSQDEILAQFKEELRRDGIIQT